MADEVRLIDVKLLTTNIAQIAKNCARSDAQKALIGRILYMIENMPTIEAEPVKPAHWYINPDGYYPQCSNCGYEPPRELIRRNGDALIFPRYCPECGADTKRKVK